MVPLGEPPLDGGAGHERRGQRRHGHEPGSSPHDRPAPALPGCGPDLLHHAILEVQRRVDRREGQRHGGHALPEFGPLLLTSGARRQMPLHLPGFIEVFLHVAQTILRILTIMEIGDVPAHDPALVPPGHLAQPIVHENKLPRAIDNRRAAVKRIQRHAKILDSSRSVTVVHRSSCNFHIDMISNPPLRRGIISRDAAA